jgi:hypothetical protein
MNEGVGESAAIYLLRRWLTPLAPLSVKFKRQGSLLLFPHNEIAASVQCLQ